MQTASKPARPPAAAIQLSLEELSARSGVAARTIRYYVQQGLLPSPGHGANARYTQGHLDRLALIRKLQRERLSLAGIRGSLAALDDKGVCAALADAVPSAGTPVTAGAAPAAAELTGRTQWERINIGALVEVNVRRPLSRQDHRRVEQLLAFARELFLTEEP